MLAQVTAAAEVAADVVVTVTLPTEPQEGATVVDAPDRTPRPTPDDYYDGSAGRSGVLVLVLLEFCYTRWTV